MRKTTSLGVPDGFQRDWDDKEIPPDMFLHSDDGGEVFEDAV